MFFFFDVVFFVGVDVDMVYLVFVEWVELMGICLYFVQDEVVIEIILGNNLILLILIGMGKLFVVVGVYFVVINVGVCSYYIVFIKVFVSEKFFVFVDVFGVENVGMIMGDFFVNVDVFIICCMVEIFVNFVFCQGVDVEVGQVVMDEFYFYGDLDCGWVWQVLLFELLQVQFILMLVIFGDVIEFVVDFICWIGCEMVMVIGVE